jgi:hypothetical protein
MAIGASGRVGVELDPVLKQELHLALKEDGRNLKNWLIDNANMYLQSRQPSFSSFQQETKQ